MFRIPQLFDEPLNFTLWNVKFKTLVLKLCNKCYGKPYFFTSFNCQNLNVAFRDLFNLVIEHKLEILFTQKKCSYYSSRPWEECYSFRKTNVSIWHLFMLPFDYLVKHKLANFGAERKNSSQWYFCFCPFWKTYFVRDIENFLGKLYSKDTVSVEMSWLICHTPKLAD